MSPLSQKHVLLGVTAGVAAYKAAELIRLLGKAGAEVQVVMTEGATHFITPMTLQALSGRPVRQALFDPAHEAAMGHIELARWADLVLVAPGTADFMARLAQGVANDLLTTLCLACQAPIAVAPAMNQAMWSNPATVENAQVLERRGVLIWGPGEGDQACGEVGPGRMLEPSELFACAEALFTPLPWSGLKVLITAGPTREAIDPVRFIGNRSSGKMGFSIARAFVRLGADVALVSGPVALKEPEGVSRIDVESAREMEEAVMSRALDSDLFVACAAVADYRPESAVEQKIKKHQDEMSLVLVKNPDILSQVAALKEGPFTLGFAAETENHVEYAQEKRRRKGVDMIAANLVAGSRGGFESDENALTVLWDEGRVDLPMADKSRLAELLVKLVMEQYEQRDSAKNT